MTKDVLISISGLQFEDEDNEPIEVVTSGNYYFKNNKHYIIYDEYIDDAELEVTKNMMIISKDKISLSKSGPASVNMLFEPGRDTETYYNTPFGSLVIGLSNSKINATHEDNLIDVNIQYDLSINYSHVSNCNICLKVTPKQ